MVRVAVLSLFLLFIVNNFDFSIQEKEVLLRDRLVLLLCDQMREYMNGDGTYPMPIKTMPKKYKDFKPGQPSGGLMSSKKRGKGDGELEEGKNRLRRSSDGLNSSGIVLDLF